MDRVKDENTSVKKVPIKIVHSESNTEKESRQYLDLPSETPVSSQEPGVTHLQSLGNPDQSYSLFCTYTRQKDPGPETRDTDMGLLKDHGPQTNVNPLFYEQTSPSLDQSNNGLSSHPLQSEDDEKRKELARDIMVKDKSLVDILDQSKMKTTMDLMEGIFPQGELLLEEAQQRRKAAPKQLSPRNSVEKSVFLTCEPTIFQFLTSLRPQLSLPSLYFIIYSRNLPLIPLRRKTDWTCFWCSVYYFLNQEVRVVLSPTHVVLIKKDF